jgi:DNA-3-methyladenine glycosylase I
VTGTHKLLADRRIIRNQQKIRSAVNNAAAFLKIQETCGSFDRYIWQFVDGRPVQNAWRRETDIPAETGISIAMSHDLKQKGFSFVGPRICYAFMQAIGMVNDHVTSCFRYEEIRHLTSGKKR